MENGFPFLTFFLFVSIDLRWVLQTLSCSDVCIAFCLVAVWSSDVACVFGKLLQCSWSVHCRPYCYLPGNLGNVPPV